ncbi:MAG TPA: BatA domain-containing protein, partial [Candidatus Acidoferrum sp.]|nr:BatA domain-containing protein [Candidatus Acidoferrum sp.]
MLIAPLFLLGVFGLALPWWLHRLQVQTTEREKFATTRFLEASKKRIHVQRKLKYLVLMGLRMAFLAFLAFAFARPVLFKSHPTVATGADSVHHVIVIDTSFSMHANGRLDAARDTARSILGTLKAGDSASLFTASTSVSPLAEQTTAEAVRNLLPGVTADNGRLDFGAMVAALNTLLKNSHAPVVLHVLSDFQQTAQAVRFADMIPEVVNGRPVTLDIQKLTSDAAVNAAVTSVVVENRSEVVATVQAFGGELAANDRQLSLSINGEGQQQLPVPATANGVAQVRFKNVKFGDGDNKVDVALTPHDVLADDDLRHTVFDNSPPAPVLLLTKDLKSLGVTYLSAALATAPRGYAVEAKAIADFDPRVLQRYPWLIVEDLGALTPTLASALADYVHGGGAVFAGLGQRSLALTSVPVLNLPLSVPPAAKDAAPPLISQIDTSHPALSDSSGWNSVNVHAMKVVPGKDDRVLIAQGNALPVLIERSIGAGRLVLFTSSLDNSASDLPVKPVFVGFMAELAQYLSKEKLLARQQVADSFLQLTQSGGGSGQV